MNLDAEWLEPDGIGGFASGTVGGARTRRYHALLLTATQPPVGRMVLVNGLEVWVQTAAGRFALSTQRYPGGGDGVDILHPRGQDYLVDFRADPWPRWTYQLPDGARIEHEIFVHRASRLTVLSWRLLGDPQPMNLELRPLFSGRDYHGMHHFNEAFAFTPAAMKHGHALWQPYPGVPGVRFWSSGHYRQEPQWYKNFLYVEERARGFIELEDLACPGVFTCDLGADGSAAMLIGAADPDPALPPIPPDASATQLLSAFRLDEEARRAQFPDLLQRSADAYLARGKRGLTILAGYPWFTDWGRDTFISIRGLCLATKRFEEAREILLKWTGSVSEGMLPNRFPDHGEAPEYNSVDASLWFIVAGHEYLSLVHPPTDEAGLERHASDQEQFFQTAEAILTGYSEGTRYGIRADPADGLLFAGQPGVALTWMDAVCDGHAFTPRIGKPVEIQALWLNALCLMAPRADRWRLLYEQARLHFQAKFWNDARGCLYDVIDCHGQPGAVDGSIRANQIFAVGGLPLTLLSLPQAQAVVQCVERELLTPMGLRTLARGEPGYEPLYGGDRVKRDGAYHQGTAWPWLLGPFVEAWVRVNGDTRKVRDEARARFVDPLIATMPTAIGLNHVAEIADAEPPHAAKGCPFQAWSVAELARLSLTVLK
jgi:predicted glycogen debranching enzyme